MARDEERLARAQEQPIVGGLPDVPGIGAALRLTPELGVHLRGLADELLVNAFPGATISRAEREMLATAVSASNDCFFCMDSHAAHAAAVLARGGRPEGEPPGNGDPPGNGEPHDDGGLLIDALKHGSSDGFDPKMQALLQIARTVGRQARDLTAADVAAAREAGASDADVQLAVLIAAAFSMYNRMVDGFRAKTPPTTEAYRGRAAEIAEHGYAFSPDRGAASRT
jgi:AhpD family alkylhydroperoxidase